MFILLRDFNDYDQYGSYFVAAFDHKSTIEELRQILGYGSEEYLKFLLNGGGRQGYEFSWNSLIEVQSGKPINLNDEYKNNLSNRN